MTRPHRPGPPGPTGAEMLRSVRRIRADPPGFLAAAQARWGDVVGFPLPRPVLLVSEPEAVDRVLRANHHAYDKATVQYAALSAVTGQGLLTSDGAAWRAARRVVQPAFHAAALDRFAAASTTAAADLAERWSRRRAGTPVDVDAAMMQLTLDVVGRGLLGADLGAGGAAGAALVAAVLDALDVVVAQARAPLPGGLSASRRRRLRRALQVVDAAVDEVVRARRADPTDPTAPRDVVDLLLAAYDGPRGAPPSAALRDELVTLVVAGHETVASALTWSWALLAQHPGAAERLHAEVDAVLGGRPATRADLPSLPWTRAVLDEALRLYPPAWVVSRRAVEEDVLAGHPVPAGALVLVSPWVLHRHPGLWAAPQEFRPERFTAGQSAARAAYLPFGAGPRLCIGREAALVEGGLVLATLAGRVALAPAGAPPRVDALVTLRPRGGLPLRVRRR